MWMTNQGCHFLHVWIRPNVDFVLTVAVSWDNFMKGFTECDITDLGASVFFTKYGSSEYISHFYHSVSSSATSCKQSMLMRRPGNGFDGSFMVRKFIQNLPSRRPYNNLIIVSTWSQILFIKWPFESTNLLSMLLHFLSVIPMCP